MDLDVCVKGFALDYILYIRCRPVCLFSFLSYFRCSFNALVSSVSVTLWSYWLFIMSAGWGVSYRNISRLFFTQDKQWTRLWWSSTRMIRDVVTGLGVILPHINAGNCLCAIECLWYVFFLCLRHPRDYRTRTVLPSDISRTSSHHI